MQTDGGAGSLLPEWLADAPPWLQLIALLVALVAVLGTLTAPVWGPAVADRIRGRTTSTSSAGPGSTEAPPASTTTPGQAPAPVERYDQKMVLIERMLTNVEREQELDRERIAGLEQELRARDATIAELRRTIEQLLARPRQDQPYRPSPGSWPGH